MSHVLVFNPALDMSFSVTIFMMGLQEEIRDVVRLHTPESVTKAAQLAILQEDV